MKKAQNIKYKIPAASRAVRKLTVYLFTPCILFLFSCNDEDSTIAPKPRAYFRISFPEKSYQKYDTGCPFGFEIPGYANVSPDNTAGAEPCWLNLNFPRFRGTLHLTYKVLHNDIDSVLEKTYLFVAKHQIKASGIEEQQISKKASKVYGLIYNIDGNAASPLQFFLTDSVHNYIRGALYFNAVPNTDSIAPVLEFIKKDIYRLIETFEWEKTKPVLPKASK